MMPYGLFFILVLSLMFPVPGQGAERKADGTAASAQAQQALQQKQQEAQNALKKEMKLLGELERLDRQLEEEQEAAQNISRQWGISQEKIRSLNSEIEKISGRMEHRKELFTKRVSAIYKHIRIGTIAALFSAESFPELLMRHKYLVSATRFDSGLIGGYQEDLLRLGEQKRSLSREIQLQGHLKEERESRVRSFNQSKKQKESMLHMVRMEKASHMQALVELEKANQELNRMITSLRPLDETSSSAPLLPKALDEPGKLPKESTGFIERFKGKLSPPVNGKVIERFGRKQHPKFNTVTFQKGIDIAASAGSEIHSIFKGRVLYAGWFPGYGKMIIIDHGKSYYSVYAHSSRLFKKVGDLVAEGDLIGLVGETGSLKGPGLYFEIRHHGVPQDPLEWIRI
jgi:septal ring factor EnvC (AmiA/AmiB activator)